MRKAVLTSLLLLGSLLPTAHAAAPTTDIAELRGGTAILQVKGSAGSRARFARRVDAVALKKLPFVIAKGSATRLRALARARRVVSAHRDRKVGYDLHESVPLAYGGVSPTSVWDAGWTGAGVNVAVVDSGVDGLHPDLEKRIVANFKVLGPAIVRCPVACTTDNTTGHGTHVAGIAVGDGTASGGYHTGMAPGAGLVAYGIGDAGSMSFGIEAFDHILAHPELDIRVVNNSWGDVENTQRFDATHPVSVATKALTDAGISVVFSAGNRGPDASDCGTRRDELGRPTETCRMNTYGVAPWNISVANGRKDRGATPGEMALGLSSSRGDPDPQPSLDGSMTVDYRPTLTAPGTNIWSARAPTGAVNTVGGKGEPVDVKPEHVARYDVATGTSMAAPHVAGAIAVLQQKAKAVTGSFLSPAAVKQVLVQSAEPMGKRDMLWDWPCGAFPGFECGTSGGGGLTGEPYADWQVGAGGLNVRHALELIG